MTAAVKKATFQKLKPKFTYTERAELPPVNIWITSHKFIVLHYMTLGESKK